MRNVDRDILRAAVKIADMQDVFTPDFEKDVRVLLEETAERQSLLEALAFGTVVLKIFRVVIFMVRLLPQTRLLIIVLAIFVAIDRFTKETGLPTAEDLLAVAEETGLTDLASQIRDAIEERFRPLRANMETLFNQSRQVLTDGLFDIEALERQIDQAFSRVVGVVVVEGENKVRLQSTLLAMQRQAAGVGNLVSNVTTLFIEGSLGATIAQLDALIGANLDFLKPPNEEN